MVAVIHDVAHVTKDELRRVMPMTWLERYDFKEKGLVEIVLVMPADPIVMVWSDPIRHLRKHANGYDPGNLLTSKTCLRFLVEQFNPAKVKFDSWMDIKSPQSLAKGRSMVVDNITLTSGKKAMHDLGLAAGGILSTLLKRDVQLVQDLDVAYFERYEYFPNREVAPYRLNIRGVDIGCFLLDTNENTARSYSDGVARCKWKTLKIDDSFSMRIRKCYSRSTDQKNGGRFCAIEVEYLAGEEVVGAQTHWGDEKRAVEILLSTMRDAARDVKETTGAGVIPTHTAPRS